MNQSTACIFPDTLPDERLFFPLVQVFGTLVQMQAVEHEALDQTLLSPFITDLLQQGRLSFITPAPLGDQRDRFLALVNDMQHRGADYISQLSLLTLAGMNQRQETKNSILSSLLRRVDLPDSKKKEEELLWQARVVLKLGAFYDRQQADINEALGRITRQREQLLTELREEEDNIFSLTGSLQDTTHGTTDIVRHTLKAWTRLFFHTPPAVGSAVYITGDEEAMDTLQETYATQTGSDPFLITVLDLPDCEDNPVPVVPLADSLLARCSASLQESLLKLTQEKACTPDHLETMATLFAQQSAMWSECLQACYPANTFGRCSLELVAFAEISADRLFKESFDREHLTVYNNKEESPAGVIVGLVKKD